MYILGLHTGHDAAACLFKDGALIAFCKEERITRNKNDGGFFQLQAIDEVLDIAGISRHQVDVLALTRMKLPQACFRKTATPGKMLRRKLLGRQKDLNLAAQMIATGASARELVDTPALLDSLALRADVPVHFSNHHLCHVLACWYYVDWPNDALYVSCDGGGDGAQYSAYIADDDNIRCVLGGEETLQTTPQNTGASIGLAYAHATQLCGFTPNRHEGKLTGLAAHGQPTKADALFAQWRIDADGSVHSRLADVAALQTYLNDLFADTTREDIAASIQQVTEHLLCDWIEVLRRNHPGHCIGLSGGVFSNVRLNQKIAELPDVTEVFVYPAMGDEGLPVGAGIDWLVNIAGHKPRRQRLKHLYYGKPYAATDLISLAERRGFRIERSDHCAQRTAQLLQHGDVGAVFWQGMELGPRALGARSIVASPADRGVNDSINKRLQRTEFMPFAPVVRDADADQVFEIDDRNRYACYFMTMTTGVRAAWRDRIPAVVHVDATARPQIIRREDNPLYYDIVGAFYEISGLPCVVNTSFNAHEEPIINTPAEALNALAEDRVDFLVCDQALIFPGKQG